MRWVFDRDLNRLVMPGTLDPVVSLDLKRGAVPWLEVEFVKGAEASPLTKVPVEFVFAGKAVDDVDGEEPMLLANEWALDVATGRWKSRIRMSEELSDLFDTVETVTLTGELSFTDEDDFPQKSQTLAVEVERDVWKGTETTPLVIPTPQEWLDENLPPAVERLDDLPDALVGTDEAMVLRGSGIFVVTFTRIKDFVLTFLGNSSTRNVGITAGTVAAGDDSRLVSVTNASDGENGNADAGKLVKFGSNGQLRAATPNAVNGVSGSSSSGSGISGNSSSGLGSYAGSQTGTGSYSVSVSGTNHAEYGNSGDNRAFIRRVLGSIGWWRGAFTGMLHAAATLTANRTWALPDKDGTVALTSDISASSLAAALSIAPYTTLAEANAALGRGQIFFNTTSQTLEITTA